MERSDVLYATVVATQERTMTAPIYQYDYGLTLVVSGIHGTIEEVHFLTERMTEALIQETYTDTDGRVCCKIPDAL